jgi:hypothetical protein
MEHGISPNPGYDQRRGKQGKSKLIAVLLAVFLSCFGWLYTYKRNTWKFWLGSILSTLPILISAISMEFYVSTAEGTASQVLIFAEYAFPISVWGWAVIDNLFRGSIWYSNY